MTAWGKAWGLVPSGLDAGTYDVSAQLDDGREGTLSRAFTVTKGFWPMGYTFDPIAPQKNGSSFSVTIRAQGPAAPIFEGTVKLSSNLVNVKPTLSAPFVQGVLTQTVTVSGTPQSGIQLMAVDANGGSGTSGAFTVNP
jgi:hypothetical protein